jgi:hypothetical protein
LVCKYLATLLSRTKLAQKSGRNIWQALPMRMILANGGAYSCTLTANRRFEL